MRNLLSVFIVFLLFGCVRDGRDLSTGPSSDEINDTVEVDEQPDLNVKVEKAQIGKVQVYIENTLSMHGYFHDPSVKFTDFRNAVNELLRQSKIAYQAENVNLFLINNSTSFNVGENLDKLSTKSLSHKYFEGNGSSDFDKLFETILNQKKRDEVVVFIADYIYSPPPSVIAVKSGLTRLKQHVSDAFINTAGFDSLAVNILHLESDFHGAYYDNSNDAIPNLNNRPYYIFIIGAENNVKEYSEQVVGSLHPFRLLNEYYLTPKTFPDIYYTALPFTLNKGQFSANGTVQGKNSVESVYIKNSTVQKDNLELAVCIDLSNIPVDKQYLLDKENFELNDKRVKIIDVGAIVGDRIQMELGGESSLKSNDKALVKSSTHVIQLSFARNFDGLIEISLEKNTPKWVDEVSFDDDDEDIQTNAEKQRQTFGFSYIIDGIKDAQEVANPENEYFQISINVNHVKSGTGIGTIVGWIIGLVIIFFIVIIIVRNKQRK